MYPGTGGGQEKINADNIGERKMQLNFEAEQRYFDFLWTFVSSGKKDLQGQSGTEKPEDEDAQAKGWQ